MRVACQRLRQNCVSFMFTRFRAVKPLRNNIIAQYIYRPQSLVKTKNKRRTQFQTPQVGLVGLDNNVFYSTYNSTEHKPIHIHKNKMQQQCHRQGDVKNEQTLRRRTASYLYSSGKKKICTFI